MIDLRRAAIFLVCLASCSAEARSIECPDDKWNITGEIYLPGLSGRVDIAGLVKYYEDINFRPIKGKTRECVFSFHVHSQKSKDAGLGPLKYVAPYDKPTTFAVFENVSNTNDPNISQERRKNCSEYAKDTEKFEIVHVRLVAKQSQATLESTLLKPAACVRHGVPNIIVQGKRQDPRLPDAITDDIQIVEYSLFYQER